MYKCQHYRYNAEGTIIAGEFLGLAKANQPLRIGSGMSLGQGSIPVKSGHYLV